MIDLRKGKVAYKITEAKYNSEIVRNLIRTVEANREKFCMGWFPDDLRKGDNTKKYFILHNSTQFFGFAIIVKMKTIVKLRTICSNTKYRGAGTILMNHIENFARKNKIRRIKLLSVYDAIVFYKKLGYETKYKNYSPKKEYLCPMFKNLSH